MQLYNYERFLPHGGESSETSKANSGFSSDAKHFQSQQVSQCFPLCSAKPTDSYIPQGVHRLRSANQNRTRTFYKPNPNLQKVLLMLSVKCGHTSQFCHTEKCQGKADEKLRHHLLHLHLTGELTQ